MNHLVYALIDPISGFIRYIGKTSEAQLAYRIKSHTYTKAKTHKGFWIRSLRQSGLHFEVLVLEHYATHALALEGEQSWISLCRSWNLPLTNATDGGEGSSGAKRSQETKELIRTKLLGKSRSLDVRLKIATGHTGLKHSSITKQRMSKAHLGRKHTEVAIQRMRDAALRRNSK